MRGELIKVEVKIVTKEGNISTVLIGEGLNFFGRKTKKGEELNFPIQTRDSKVSRKHCCIKVARFGNKQSIVLFDTSSSNGTSLIGYHKPFLSDFDKVYLKHGDQILIGETKLYINAPIACNLMEAEKITGGTHKSKTQKEF